MVGQLPLGERRRRTAEEAQPLRQRGPRPRGNRNCGRSVACPLAMANMTSVSESQRLEMRGAEQPDSRAIFLRGLAQAIQRGDWLVRYCLPVWLDAAELSVEANRLRTQARLTEEAAVRDNCAAFLPDIRAAQAAAARSGADDVWRSLGILEPPGSDAASALTSREVRDKGRTLTFYPYGIWNEAMESALRARGDAAIAVASSVAIEAFWDGVHEFDVQVGYETALGGPGGRSVDLTRARQLNGLADAKGAAQKKVESVQRRILSPNAWQQSQEELISLLNG
jgi:hypothetical protein